MSPVVITGAVAAWVVQGLAAGITATVAQAVERSIEAKRRRKLMRMAVMQTMAGSLESWWTIEQLLYSLSEQQIETDLLELERTLRKLARLERVRHEGIRWGVTVTGLEYVGELQRIKPEQRWVIGEE